MKLERGVPIPPPPPWGGSKCTYGWPHMKVGDSLWYPFNSKNQRASIKVSAHAWFRNNRPHLRVITRTEEKRNRRGLRVWIIEGVTIERNAAK